MVSQAKPGAEPSVIHLYAATVIMFKLYILSYLTWVLNIFTHVRETSFSVSCKINFGVKCIVAIFFIEAALAN